MLGLTYHKLGRSEDAIKAFEDLNKLNPNQELVLTALANLKEGKDPIPENGASNR